MAMAILPSTVGKVVELEGSVGEEGRVQMEEPEKQPKVYISAPRLPSEWENATPEELGNMIKETKSNGSTSVRKEERIYHGYKCDSNERDELQWCLCEPGEKVGSMHSTHDNGDEDRVWTLRCSKVNPTYKYVPTGSSYSTTSPNNWDGTVHWDGQSDDSFLVGMWSKHRNDKEDRQFRFMVTRSDLWTRVGGCKWKFINDYDEEFNLNTLSNEAIFGLHSWHSNRHEDRVWQALVCGLRYKCASAGVLKTDITKVKFSDNQSVYEYFDDIDASKSATDIEKTMSLSTSTIKSMSNSETYSRTSGHKFSVGTKLSTYIGMNVIFLQSGGKITFSVGYETSYSTTYKTSKSTSFQEGKQGKSSWKITCKSGYICKSKVRIARVTATAPYKITAGSCREYGKAIQRNVFSGKIEKVDTYAGNAPPTSCADNGPYVQYCAKWATWACQSYNAFMTKYCPKSCKFC